MTFQSAAKRLAAPEPDQPTPRAPKHVCSVCQQTIRGHPCWIAGRKAHKRCGGSPRGDRRRPRRSRPRARSLPVRELVSELGPSGPPAEQPTEPSPEQRPKTWGECRERTGPCPWVGCPAHLYLDINPETGSLKLNFPDLEPLELAEPCVLRIAERGGLTLEETAKHMNLTRERIRQVEVQALVKLRRRTVKP